MGYKELLLEDIKRMRWFFYIPFIMILFIQPAYLILSLISSENGFEYYNVSYTIKNQIYFLYPLAGSLWTYWIMSRYTDDDDREIYYLIEKVKYKEILTLCLLFIVSIIIPICLYSIELGVINGGYLFITVSSIVFLYNILFYYGSYLFGSTKAVFTLFTIYTFIVMAPGNGDAYFISYYRLFYTDMFNGIINSIVVVIIAIILLILGIYKNRKYENYE